VSASTWRQADALAESAIERALRAAFESSPAERSGPVESVSWVTSFSVEPSGPETT
jgi:hypothetical protein